MEKLDKVIAGLECCTKERCTRCPYFECDMYCMTVLERDALSVIQSLVRKLKYARAERDAARAGKARLIGMMEKTWLDDGCDLRTGYCPTCDKHFKIPAGNSSGDCPDCGHHVVLSKVEVEE